MDIRQYICPECLVSDLKVILYSFKCYSKGNIILGFEDEDHALFGVRCSRCGFTQNFFWRDILDEEEESAFDR